MFDMKKIVYTLMLLCTFSIVASAETLEELNNKFNQLESQKKAVEAEKKKLKGQKSSVLWQINTLDKKVTNLQNDVSSLEKKVEEKRDSITKLSENLEVAKKDREVYYEAYKKRMQRQYKEGDSRYIQVIFNSKDIKDFLNRSSYIKKMAKHDNEIVADMKTSEQKIKMNRELLKTEEESLKSLKETKISKKASLDSLKLQKKREIVVIDSDLVKFEKRQRELEEQSKQVENLIRSYKTDLTFNGQFYWPVAKKTRISSYYGYRGKHPVTGKPNNFHRGIDIPAATGYNLRASASGKVITSTVLNGYGNTIIVDHGAYNGNTYTTLYAHNSRLVKKVGETIKAGEVIGKIGSTGWSTGPHSHFEIRVNGKHTNPLEFVKSSKYLMTN